VGGFETPTTPNIQESGGLLWRWIPENALTEHPYPKSLLCSCLFLSPCINNHFGLEGKWIKGI